MSRPEHVVPNDTLPPDFADFIAALNAHDVEYVLVGGWALAVYNVIRSTGDFDIFHRRTTENVRKLMAAMREFGAPEHVIDEVALMDPEAITYFGQEPLRIDLLNSISGVSFDAAWAKVIEVSTGSERMRVIGLDELIVNKRASNRPKDKHDARQLLKANPGATGPDASTRGASDATAPRKAKAGTAAPRTRGKAGAQTSTRAKSAKGRKAPTPSAGTTSAKSANAKRAAKRRGTRPHPRDD